MIKKGLFVVLAISVSISLCLAQEKESPYISEANPSACEINSLHFDIISNDAQGNKERIFVIFRAGKDETETVNVKRFNYVKNFLENSKGWKVLDVIYARGEKNNNSGKIEFYIKGKLLLIVNSLKNRTPCLDCCENELHYP